MSIEKNDDSPLGVKASRKNQDLAYEETHRVVGRGEYCESSVEEARQEILSHYKIPLANVAIYPEVSGRKREIRIFMILENKKTGERFYADGHAPHAIILDYIFQKFPRIGIRNRGNLPEDWGENWKTRKGFIDPYMNGFRNFPQVRKALIREMEIRGQNSLSEEEVRRLKDDPENEDIKLPNWILSI